MRRAIVLLALPFLTPAMADGQAKAAKMDVPALRAKLLAAAYLEGTLKEADVAGDERTFTLEFVQQTRKPKAGGQAKYAEAARRYNEALNIRSTSLEQIKKLYGDVKDAEKNAFDIEETAVPFQLSAGKTLLVRNLAVPTGKDGKKLSAAEVQKLRGDGRYPGYAAALKDVAVATQVRAYVDKAKLKPGAAKSDDTVYPITILVLVPPPEMGDEFKPIK